MMNKGTVIYVGNFELPDKGASAHRVMNNGKLLQELGYRVLFLGVTKDGNFSGIRRSKTDERIYEQAYPYSTRQWFSRLVSADELLSLAEQQDDLRAVILYNLPYITVKAVKKAFRGTDVTVAYDCTEWTDYTEGSFPKRLYKKLDAKDIEKKLPKICRDIIVVSRTMEKQYAGSNLILLPPLVDTDDPIWHQPENEREGGFEFCFAAGTLENKERMDIMLRAFCKLELTDAHLRIIGVTKEEYLQAYPQDEDIVKADSRIIFTGRLSHEETVRAVSSCDCYIFIRGNIQRNNAGFPTKFAEAYTCSVPIITTDVSDVAGYITSPQKGRVLTEAEPDQIRSAMESVYHDRSIGKRELDKSFDYRNYISGIKEWMSRLS